MEPLLKDMPETGNQYTWLSSNKFIPPWSLASQTHLHNKREGSGELCKQTIYRRTDFNCKNLIVSFSRVCKLLIFKHYILTYLYVQFAQTQLLNLQCKLKRDEHNAALYSGSIMLQHDTLRHFSCNNRELRSLFHYTRKTTKHVDYSFKKVYTLFNRYLGVHYVLCHLSTCNAVGQGLYILFTEPFTWLGLVWVLDSIPCVYITTLEELLMQVL